MVKLTAKQLRELEEREDEEDVRDAKRILKLIKAGKMKVYNAKEFEKRTGLKIT